MSMVVNNLVLPCQLASDVVRERGIVTLLQQIRRQLVPSLRRFEVEPRRALAGHRQRRLALALVVAVSAQRAGGDVLIDPRGGQLAADAQPPDPLAHARAHESLGESLVIEPLLLAQAGDD